MAARRQQPDKLSLSRSSKASACAKTRATNVVVLRDSNVYVVERIVGRRNDSKRRRMRRKWRRRAREPEETKKRAGIDDGRGRRWWQKGSNEGEDRDSCRRALKNVPSPEKAAPVPASAAPALLALSSLSSSSLVFSRRRPSSSALNWPPLRAPLPRNPRFLSAC